MEISLDGVDATRSAGLRKRVVLAAALVVNVLLVVAYAAFARRGELSSEAVKSVANEHLVYGPFDPVTNYKHVYQTDDESACTYDLDQCKPACFDITACLRDCQCQEELNICNQEMDMGIGKCDECEVLSMMECLLHPCKCRLVDMVNRCVSGESTEACVAWKTRKCDQNRCKHHEFLHPGPNNVHYLGGSNIVDPHVEFDPSDFSNLEFAKALKDKKTVVQEE